MDQCRGENVLAPITDWLRGYVDHVFPAWRHINHLRQCAFEDYNKVISLNTAVIDASQTDVTKG